MHRQVTRSVVTVCIALCGLFATTAGAIEVLGEKPSYIQGEPGTVPNDQAITKMIWAPGLDDGYDPQGVTWANGAVYLSAYRSKDIKVDTGPCRIFKIDPESGKALAQFDLPKDCEHAGGLAYVGKGILILADERKLYRIDMAAAFQQGNPATAITATVGLQGELRGAFVDLAGAYVFDRPLPVRTKRRQ